MASPSLPGAARFSRRTLLASAGVLALAAGCTASEQPPPQVTRRQADRLARQVAVQEALVSAFAAAAAADAQLAGPMADLAEQATQQLTRLRAAAPGARASSSAASSSAASSSAASASSAAASSAGSRSGPGSGAAGSAGPPPGTDVRAWLREQVAAAAASHGEACLDQVGGRAALLGSIAAGLRGQDGRLA